MQRARVVVRAMALSSFLAMLVLAVVQAQGCREEPENVPVTEPAEAPAQDPPDPDPGDGDEVAPEVEPPPAAVVEPAADLAAPSSEPAGGDPVFLPASKSGRFILDDEPQASP